MPPDIREREASVVAIDELSTVLGVESWVVAEYVELGLVTPGGRQGVQDLPTAEIARLSRALRLARELELHAAAAVLLVDLLEERDALRRRVSCLEQISGSGVL